MNLMEQAAYLRGLADGLELDWDKKENKLMLALLDLVDEMAASIHELEESAESVEGELDEIAEELIAIEQEIGMDVDYDDEDDCDCGCCGGDDYCYEVVCPTCGDHISVDESLLEAGKINCPNCDEELEFELDDDDDCCDCGCHSHN